MIRILLVDDQKLVQQGIKSLLEQDQNFEVIGTVEDGKSAIKQVNLLRPDIVLLDIEMPGMNGITVTKYINHFLPETKVIILSSHEEKKYLVQALVAGARSYILKNSLMKDLKQAILAVNNGYSLIESRLLARVLNSGTVKLVPVKSEISQNNVKPKMEKPKQPDNFEPDEINPFLVHKNETVKDATNELLKNNLTDMAATSILVQPETTQNQNTVRETVAQEQSEIVQQLNHQSHNVDDISSSSIMSSSNSENSMVETEVNSLNSSSLEEKNKIYSGSINNLPEVETKDNISQSDQAELQKLKQNVSSSPLYNLNLDELSYPNQINLPSLNTSNKEDSTALVPVSLSRNPSTFNSSSKISFRSNVVRSKTKIVASKRNYLYRIFNQPKVQKLRLQIERLLKPISPQFNLYFKKNIKPWTLKYISLFNKYKSKLLKLLNRRSNQKTFWNLGFMISGGIVVLLIYSL